MYVKHLEMHSKMYNLLNDNKCRCVRFMSKITNTDARDRNQIGKIRFSMQHKSSLRNVRFSYCSRISEVTKM